MMFRFNRAGWLSRLVLNVAVMAGAVAAGSASSQAQETPTASDVIAKYVTAIGGKDALTAVKTTKIEGKMEIVGTGVFLEMLGAQSSDGYLLKVVLPGGEGDVQRGRKGDVAWSIDPQHGARVLEGEEKAQFMQQARIREELTWLEGYDGEISVAGEDVVDDQPAWKLTFAHKTAGTTERWFSKSTGLLIKAASKVANPDGPLNVTIKFDDYREFGGIKVACKQVQSAVTGELTQAFSITYDKVELNAEIPESTFEIPAQVKAKIQN